MTENGKLLHPDAKSVLFSVEQIQKRVKELARQIADDYKSSEDLTVVGILHGAFVFVADLAREIEECRGPRVRVDFMAVSSYGDESKTTGAVKIIMDCKNSVVGKDVLIVEDIIDSGLTLKYLLEMFSKKGARSLQVVVLLKKDQQAVAVDVKYFGFLVPKDAFIVGYGLDYAGSYRCLKYVAELKPEVYAKNS